MRKGDHAQQVVVESGQHVVGRSGTARDVPVRQSQWPRCFFPAQAGPFMHKQADTLSHCAVSAVHQLEGRVGPPPQQQWLSRLPARSLPHTPCSRTPPQRSPPTCGCMFCGRLRLADPRRRTPNLKHRVPTSDMRRRNKKRLRSDSVSYRRSSRVCSVKAASAGWRATSVRGGNPQSAPF